MAFPRGVMGLSAVCDCGISGSYSLAIFEIDMSRVLINLCAIWIKDYIRANISHGELGTENNIGIGLDLPTKCADNRQRTHYKERSFCEKKGQKTISCLL